MADLREKGADWNPQLVAHEINNPLTSVSANLDLLADEDLEPSVREMVSEAQEGVARIKRIVGELEPSVGSDLPVPPPREGSILYGRVLVIDDDPSVGSALRRILRGHEVELVHSGADALRILAERSFDIILCDLMMPDLTGMDVHRELAVLRPDCLARIVFITGGVFTTAARSFLDRVPNERIDKPFDVPGLRALVASYVAINA